MTDHEEITETTETSLVNIPIKDQTAKPGRRSGSSRWPWLLAILGLVLLLGGAYWFWGEEILGESPLAALGLKEQSVQPQTPGQESSSGSQEPARASRPGGVPEPPAPSQSGPVVALPAQGGQAGGGAGNLTPEQQAEQAQRKEPYGLSDSLDVVVRSDEILKLGEKSIPVAELERKLTVDQRGEVLDRPLDAQGQKDEITVWGIYVVRPGQNLWVIHRAILTEYLASRGVELPPGADQPKPSGLSTDVGKILKFAEHMVGVYNIHSNSMTKDLNLLEPGEKVVVFNLTEMFGQLTQMDPHDIDGVMYDGRMLIFHKKP